MERLSGSLVFPGTTALPPGSMAYVKVLPIGLDGASKPVAEIEVPAKTGNSIPFVLKFPAASLSGGGEYLVVAQVIHHGTVQWSNLANPLRVSFAAEPSNVQIPLRPER